MLNQVAMGCKPDPTKFTIKTLEHWYGNTIVVANYGGLTFGGDKLIVLDGIHTKFETLDPHFLNEDHPVIARFQPNAQGYKLAKLVCLNHNSVDKRLDTIFDVLDRYFQDNDFLSAEGYLYTYCIVDKENNLDILLGYLTASLPAKDKLTKFVIDGKTARQVIVEMVRNHKLYEDGLLTGLE